MMYLPHEKCENDHGRCDMTQMIAIWLGVPDFITIFSVVKLGIFSKKMESKLMSPWPNYPSIDRMRCKIGNKCIKFRQPTNLLDRPSNMKIGLCQYQIKNGLMWTYNLIGHSMVELERKKERKITPIHCTGMNVSPLSKCLTRWTMLQHEELCLFWEVGSIT